MLILGRRESFCAAHKLWDAKLSSQENKDLFGKCTQTHGHNYQLYVEVKTEPRSDVLSGMVINTTQLSMIVQSVIVKLDHKNLNDVEWFFENNATVENIAIFIWNELKNVVKPPVELHLVKVEETENNYAYMCE
jgi:6-pyruvoyltetrahydropterin/6-carboxytetrahydropterin synthase